MYLELEGRKNTGQATLKPNATLIITPIGPEKSFVLVVTLLGQHGCLGARN